MFHCVNGSRFLCSFVCRWALGLLPALGCCEERCCECECTSVFSDPSSDPLSRCRVVQPHVLPPQCLEVVAVLRTPGLLGSESSEPPCNVQFQSWGPVSVVAPCLGFTCVWEGWVV